ncbi:MAG: CbiQ family ECF transporter T component [Solirubrobacterales bacterium]
MRPALAYRPGRSPLHRARPALAIAYLGAFAAIAFAFLSPVVLAAAGAGLVLCGLAAGARRAVVAALRLGGTLLLLMAAVNALVNHRGETVLVRGWELPVLGGMDVTLESLVAGGAIGLRVAVVVLAFAIYSACVDPDAVLRALRPLARRSALTAALVARMVPLAVADFAALREAASLRGPAAAPAGPAALTRRLVEGSLDRAVDVAATLELRGHSLPGRAAPASRRCAPAPGLAASAAGVAAAGAAALAVGAGSFEAFPRIEMALDPATLALCAALPALGLAPFARLPRRAHAAAPRPATAGGQGG